MNKQASVVSAPEQASIPVPGVDQSADVSMSQPLGPDSGAESIEVPASPGAVVTDNPSQGTAEEPKPEGLQTEMVPVPVVANRARPTAISSRLQQIGEIRLAQADMEVAEAGKEKMEMETAALAQAWDDGKEAADCGRDPVVAAQEFGVSELPAAVAQAFKEGFVVGNPKAARLWGMKTAQEAEGSNTGTGTEEIEESYSDGLSVEEMEGQFAVCHDDQILHVFPTKEQANEEVKAARARAKEQEKSAPALKNVVTDAGSDAEKLMQGKEAQTHELADPFGNLFEKLTLELGHEPTDLEMDAAWFDYLNDHPEYRVDMAAALEDKVAGPAAESPGTRNPDVPGMRPLSGEPIPGTGGPSGSTIEAQATDFCGRYEYSLEGENSNKFYEIKHLGQGEYELTWGRIGTSGQSKVVTEDEALKKAMEKSKKGYVKVATKKIAVASGEYYGVYGQADELVSGAVYGVNDVHGMSGNVVLEDLLKNVVELPGDRFQELLETGVLKKMYEKTAQTMDNAYEYVSRCTQMPVDQVKLLADKLGWGGTELGLELAKPLSDGAISSEEALKKLNGLHDAQATYPMPGKSPEFDPKTTEDKALINEGHGEGIPMDPSDAKAWFDKSSMAEALEKEAVDEKTKQYFTDYYGGYGKELTKDVALPGQKTASKTAQQHRALARELIKIADAALPVKMQTWCEENFSGNHELVAQLEEFQRNAWDDEFGLGQIIEEAMDGESHEASQKTAGQAEELDYIIDSLMQFSGGVDESEHSDLPEANRLVIEAGQMLMKASKIFKRADGREASRKTASKTAQYEQEGIALEKLYMMTGELADISLQLGGAVSQKADTALKAVKDVIGALESHEASMEHTLTAATKVAENGELAQMAYDLGHGAQDLLECLVAEAHPEADLIEQADKLIAQAHDSLKSKGASHEAVDQNAKNYFLEYYHSYGGMLTRDGLPLRKAAGSALEFGAKVAVNEGRLPPPGGAMMAAPESGLMQPATRSLPIWIEDCSLHGDRNEVAVAWDKSLNDVCSELQIRHHVKTLIQELGNRLEKNWGIVADIQIVVWAPEKCECVVTFRSTYPTPFVPETRITELRDLSGVDTRSVKA